MVTGFSHGDDMSSYIGAATAAEVVGVSVETITRAARSGQLPYVLKMPGPTGAYLFTREAVEAYAQERAA
jgi:excisionase family DNA binding protein